MKISRPVLVNGILGLVIVAAIVGVLVFVLPKSASGSGDATQLTSTVQQGVVSNSITASGQIDAEREVNANFKVSGTISTITVTLGDTVKKGDTLAMVGKSTLKKSVSTAKSDLNDAWATLSDANSSYSRAKKSGTDDQISSAKSQVRSAQKQVNSARDAVETAEDNLSAATLKAPISGLVVAINSSVGDSVTGSGGSSVGGTTTAFITIADVDKLTMTASIAEADIADVEEGQTATVSFPALTDTTASATVTAIAPTATASNSVVTYATTITLDAIPDGLRLGQTAEVSIVIESSEADVLYVPSAAITTVTDATTGTVTSTVDVVADDGTTSTVTVTTGVVGDQGTEITSGLTASQTIVIGTVSATDTSDGSTTGGTETRGGFGGNLPDGVTPPTGGIPGGN
jgi:membrane fusion protein, macrolide-specific efflux system